jgi:glucose-6-phosphate isomerase
MAGIHFYYKNVTSQVLGDAHGISPDQFDKLKNDVEPIIDKLYLQRKDGKTPYRDLPYDQQMVNKVKTLTAELNGRFENLVVLGIGGSALGNIALQTALNPFMYNMDSNQRKGPRLFVFDNVDPAQLSSFLDWIADKLDKTLFNVISKSGRTAETAAQFLIIKKLLNDRLGPDAFAKNVLATTDPAQGTMRKIADEHKLKTLTVPAGVGGRFSVLSHVGLFSAAMCGIDIDELLAGARDMDQRVAEADFYKNPAALNAAINVHYYKNAKPISVMMPYSYNLKDLSDWYRQLWAESLGKANDLDGNIVNVGPTPIKALGTTDQHSQVQLYRQGPNDKLFTFLEVKDLNAPLTIGPAPDCAPELDYLNDKPMANLLNAEKKATEYALVQDKRPCLTVLFDKITPFTVGQFIYFYEVTTSIAGELLNINTYDQPAVELGKEATFALMGCDAYADLAQKIKPFAEVDQNYLV